MMNELSANKLRIQKASDLLAPKRATYFNRNRYYNRDLMRFYKFCIPEGSKVLEIGCGTGDLLNSLKPSLGVGIDISSEMILHAKSNFPNLEFHQMDAENITLKETLITW